MYDWDQLYEAFKQKLEAVSGECYRVKSTGELLPLISDLLKRKNVKSVAYVDSPIIRQANLRALDQEFEVYSSDHRNTAPLVDAGITEMQWGIAELGTMVQTAVDINERLVSCLPPIHIALLRTKRIIPTLMETMATLHRLPEIPGFVGFVTGPSRTSDIERVLTIGVHGPGEFIAILVDEEENGEVAANA